MFFLSLFLKAIMPNKSIEAMKRYIWLSAVFFVLFGSLYDDVEAFSTIGQQTLIYVDDQGPHAYNMTTLTCRAGESFSWEWSGKSYNFTCGTIEHIYSVQQRTYVPFDTRTYASKMCCYGGTS
jgi:plastocyanin